MLNVFLTDLTSYNKGILYGEWLSLPMNEDNLAKAIEKILCGGEAVCAIEYGYEKHEEYFIIDFEWEEINLWNIGEYDNLTDLNNKLSLLEYSSITDLKAIRFLLDEGFAENLEDAITKTDDVIIYENQTMDDMAYNLLEELYDIDKHPSIISNNIDYSGVARDLEYEGIYHIIDNDIYEYTA